jgi:glycerophosphoryl diester phosphodiesterase/Zn-dependent protease with chaperone function
VNEDKASRYHRLRRRAEILGTLTAGGLLLTLLVTPASLVLREYASMTNGLMPAGFEEAGTVISFAIALSILLHIVELPFAYLQGFVLEHRYGLSNQTFRHWVGDQAKAGALVLVFAAIGASIVYAALRASPGWWWLISAVLFALLMIVLAQLAPVLLLPLFYTFKPLDRPALVQRLLALASRANTQIRGVFEWTLSAHTKKANAALAGMGRTRRILLSDTLLADYSDDEIEVVLAHELSHHVHHDLWRAVAAQTTLLVAGFYVAHLALTRFADRLALRGLDDPAGLPLLLLVGGVCSFVFLPLANALSRAHERRADRYALELTHQPDAFISAMKRLSQQNMAEEHPSQIVQWLFYSHPPIRARINAARQWAERHVPRVACLAAVVILGAISVDAQNSRKLNVAHRGASAYAPEHTLAAYQLALAQGADFVEPDLAVTKDGVLICLHGIDGGPPDFPGLERTTNVEELFPDRATEVDSAGNKRRVWLSTDFTLAEIKTLDAGSWFDKKFAGERVATFQEMIDLVKGKAGIIPELKAPEFYHARKIQFEELTVSALAKNGLLEPGAVKETPVILQSFNPVSIEKLVSLNVRLPIVRLVYTRDAAMWSDRARVTEARKRGATILGPSKVVLDRHPQLVEWAHAEKMRVVPYTFRADQPGKYANVKAEMEHYLYTLGVDGLFTNNPDQFPRR